MSENPYILLSSARADLESHAAFLEDRTVGNAIKFFAAVREMFDLIAEFPFLGVMRPSPNPRLHSIRYMRIRGFEKYLIFYRPLASKDGIVIYNVLHSSRDAEALLSESVGDSD